MSPDRYGGEENEFVRGSQSGELRERILSEFKGVREDIRDLEIKIDYLKDKTISDMKIEIATLKVKAGVWGLIGATVPITLQLLIKYIPR